MGGLKGLAELLGWEYELIKTGRKVGRAVVVSLEELLGSLI